MYRRYIFLPNLLMIAVLVAGSKSVAGEHCSEKYDDLVLDPDKLPAVATADSLYECFGLAEHLRGFDRLERDLIIMHAMNNAWTEFKRLEASGSGETYEERFPIEPLREFHSFIRGHTRQ